MHVGHHPAVALPSPESHISHPTPLLPNTVDDCRLWHDLCHSPDDVVYSPCSDVSACLLVFVLLVVLSVLLRHLLAACSFCADGLD